MAGRGSKPGEHRGGRVKGVPNKVTQDIRALIQSRVDFPELIDALKERAAKNSEQAAKLLFEYGYGKPSETVNVNASISQTEIARAAAEVLYAAGSGIMPSQDTGLSAGPGPVQDGSRGTEKLQDGDCQADAGT